MLDKVHKLLPRLCLIESTGEIGSCGDGILFLYASHLHAHVLGLDHHHYTQRIERLLNAFLNLQRHALLHLKPVREDVYHTGNLAQPRDVAVRNISHVRFAIERQHVVLAQGEEP